jgi:signal recognition particle subunit SRP54
VERKATGQRSRSRSRPGQQVVKIVHDELVRVLAGRGRPEALKIDNPPAPILMVGLQGGGKTTTTAKLARRLKEREGKRCSWRRWTPTARRRWSSSPSWAARSAWTRCRSCRARTPWPSRGAPRRRRPGRLRRLHARHRGAPHIDEALIRQAAEVRDAVKPRETLLVVDGLTGQVAVEVAKEFDDKIGVSGVVPDRGWTATAAAARRCPCAP